jgi:NTP pyrophosphatase (non-canonical NTP hydrolase)
MSSEHSLHELRSAIRQFNAERDWGQFHTPKNLAAGLVIEAAEVLEVLQWDESATAEHVPATKRARLAEEVGDVLIHLVNLADKLEIDLVQCGLAKLKRNEAKYPADRVRGSAKKYDEYEG